MLDQGSAEAEMREQVGEMALLMAAKEQQIEALHVKILAQAELLQGVDEGRHATAQRLESWLLEILSSNGRHSWAGEALDDPSHDAGHAQFGNGIDATVKMKSQVPLQSRYHPVILIIVVLVKSLFCYFNVANCHAQERLALTFE